MLEFIQSIPQTFYSPRFYATLIRQGRGIGMEFILLNVALCLFALLPGLPPAQNGIEDVMGRLPSISIKDQKLSMDRESPYAVNFTADPKAPSIVFNTSPQQYTVADIGQQMEMQHMVALVTSDFVALRTHDKTELHYFKDYKQWTESGVDVTHDQWVAFGHKIILWSLPVLFVFMFIALFFWRMIVTIVQALVVKLFALIGNVNPDFGSAMRLSAAAAVPLVILETALQIAFHIHMPFFLGILVWFGFTVFGLASANRSLKPAA